jgi:hypothetical protein
MEDAMINALTSLTFTTLPKSTVNPTLDRRTKIIARLEEQKALLRDPGYMRLVRAWGKNDSGEKAMMEKKQRVLPAGWKPVEFEKGKAAIAVPSLEKLPSVIDTVIAAVRAGELDEQLAHASAQATPKKSKAK